MGTWAPNGPKIARNKYRGLRHTKLLYLTYVLTFPDGDRWVKQNPMTAHQMDVELKNMMLEHGKKDKSEWRDRAMALWKCGECWWKDNLGAEHLMLIEEKKRVTSWGADKKGLGTIKRGIEPNV